MTRKSPRIAVTMGDPAGVGPELCLRLLDDPEVVAECTPVVFGDAEVLRRVARATGLQLSAPIVNHLDWGRHWHEIQRPTVLDLQQIEAETVIPGRIDARCGAAAFGYVQASIDAAMAGQVAGVTTGPLNKAALHAAGHCFPGHTEIFAERMGVQRFCMMQYSKLLTCTFVTVHVGYLEVPRLLTIERIVDVIELTRDALRRIHGQEPKLLVCGLNPHAGEGGLFGRREEQLSIEPAIRQARSGGADVTGPVPADTAFLPATRQQYDAVVCMYHDQGHIPIKMIAFDSAVNTTLGLPVPRTSVDHGTAFDIAWQGQANPGSLHNATRLASQLA
ncbi:MAG: 4-hydroxythreonine-4-phosphate dehydrogenase PdxA [Planctomycetaceae bacterium]|nr:MAG: 4-hydroxythreonine-4-phosphate dehydrogenase PdxA [Planctomycetaceae bacterium]